MFLVGGCWEVCGCVLGWRCCVVVFWYFLLFVLVCCLVCVWCVGCVLFGWGNVVFVGLFVLGGVGRVCLGWCGRIVLLVVGCLVCWWCWIGLICFRLVVVWVLLFWIIMGVGVGYWCDVFGELVSDCCVVVLWLFFGVLVVV